MANQLNTIISSGFKADLVGSPTLGKTAHSLSPAAVEMKTGTAANQANQLYSAARTLAASTNEDLDLSGSLQNPFGESIAFAKVKAIKIKAASANGGNIVVGGAVANAFVGWFGAAANTIVLPAGAEIQLAAPVDGWDVTAGTGDLLRIANDDGAAAASYEIEIVGTE